MPRQPERAAIRALLRVVDRDLLLARIRPVHGGTSATITYIEAARPGGQPERLLLRQYGPADVAANPRVAATEYELLASLHGLGLPVPRPYLADESGAIVGGPCLLIEFVDGTPLLRPPGPPDCIAQLADALARLHEAGAGWADIASLRDIRDISSHKLGTWPDHPDQTLSEATVRVALAGTWPPAQANRTVALHGDYWPGNTLWRDGRLVAVIDWEDAAFGDPLADLGNIRLEVTMMFGAPAADEFTRHYSELMPDLDLAALPLWDLFAALRPAGKMAGWGLPPVDLQRFQAGHREFVARALGRLPKQT